MFGVLNDAIYGLLLLGCYELGFIVISGLDAKFIGTCVGGYKEK